MKQLSLGPIAPNATDKEKLDWLIRAVRSIENASREDPVTIFDSYSVTGTNTTTRAVNVTSPTAANAAAVLATLIDDFKKRGVNRVAPT